MLKTITKKYKLLIISIACATLFASAFGLANEALPALITSNSNDKITVTRITNKLKQLTTETSRVKQMGLDVTREEMTITLAKLFLKWAQWDEKNPSINQQFYSKHKIYKKHAKQLSYALPAYERSSINKLLTLALNELKQVELGQLVRAPVPNLDYEKVIIKDQQFKVNKNPVFVQAYTWKPDDPETNAHFGNLNSQFISPNFINNNGKPDERKLKKLVNGLDNRMGQVFVSHASIPDWAFDKHPDLAEGSRLFSKYDIDHPFAKVLFSQLFEAFVPVLKGKRSTSLGYMVFNEPSFFTQKDAWNSGGVSSYTIDKFKTWLKTKHKTISKLNELWGSSFHSFETINIAIPMSADLKNTPIWYDWMYFNQIRVTQWFTFLITEIKKHDPTALTHIKLMPWLWNTSIRDHGLDYESLLRLTDIIGFDANSEYSNLRGKKPYQSHYSFDWQSPMMAFDFFSSIQPNQIMWDSENHFFTKVAFKEKDIETDFIRAIYLMAATHGLSGTSTWVWARNKDGSIIQHRKINDEYIVDVTHQPLGLHELTRTVMDINAHKSDIHLLAKASKPLRIFYSETSAIAQKDYMSDIGDAYRNVYFEGAALGFASEKIIEEQLSKHPSDLPIIIVQGTENVTTAELTALNQHVEQGGYLLVDKKSLLLNEYGVNHPQNIIPSGKRVLKYHSSTEQKAMSISLLKQRGSFPLINVVERKNTLTSSLYTSKSVAWRVANKNKNTLILSIINTGKSAKTIDILPDDSAYSLTIRNLITGQHQSLQTVLALRETLLLEVTLNRKTNIEEK